VNYTYDSIGELQSALGKESGGSSRSHEQFGYAYDAAGNLQYRTNNALIQTFTVDPVNELTNVTRSGTLTIAGTTTSTATSVTVKDNTNSAQAATLYGDATFARTGISLLNGNNTFVATASDASGRSRWNSTPIIQTPRPGTRTHIGIWTRRGNRINDTSLAIPFRATEKGRCAMMKEAATITFNDADSTEEAVAIVRYDESRVALCLSLKSDGDVEVVMMKADAGTLIEALKEAMNQTRRIP
jgi:hypothetical protein